MDIKQPRNIFSSYSPDYDIFIQTPKILEGCDNDSLFILDSADLQLIGTCGDKRIVFHVSSHAMALASPVWEKFINPPFPRLLSEEETEYPNDKQIDFSEDKGEALLILLRIAHLQFSKVPIMPSFRSIVALAVLCDKYDCAGLVKPWLPFWLVNEEAEWKEPDHEEWLFIAWTFGKEKTFTELAMKLVKEVKTDENGDCLTPKGDIMPSQMPPDIIENILKVRRDIIGELLKVPYGYVDRFASNNVCRLQSARECDALVYGSLLKSLQNFDLWPRKSPDAVTISLQDLASRLSSLQIFAYPIDKFTHISCSHYQCILPEIKVLTADIMSRIPSPVLESHRRQMKSRLINSS